MNQYPTDFIQTGNAVPVSEQELYEYVYENLERYDNLLQASEAQPSYSPYTQPIIYTSNNGKQVQIPEEIQKNAIDMWKKRKHENHKLDLTDLQKEQVNEGFTHNNTHNNTEENIPVDKNNKSNKVNDNDQDILVVDRPIYIEKSNNRLLYIIIILVLLLGSYYVYRTQLNI